MGVKDYSYYTVKYFFRVPIWYFPLTWNTGRFSPRFKVDRIYWLNIEDDLLGACSNDAYWN